MKKKQKENTAKTFLDLAKVLFISFVIGGFIPGSPINGVRILLGALFSLILYIAAMILLVGRREMTNIDLVMTIIGVLAIASLAFAICGNKHSRKVLRCQ